MANEPIVVKDTKDIDPALRAQNFNRETRQHFQPIAAQSGSESGTIRLEIPKARLLARSKLLVKCTLNAIHAANATYTPHEDAPFKFIRRVKFTMNEGADPFSISGQGLYALNLTTKKPSLLTRQNSGRYPMVQGVAADTSGNGGADNEVFILLDLQHVVNDRDPVGYIQLQNTSAIATVEIDLGTAADFHDGSAGYTFAVSAITAQLLVESFAIPAMPAAKPNLQTMKIVQERTETMVVGENVIELPVGRYTYRKIGLYFQNSTPARPADTIFDGNFQVVLNTSDRQYEIPVDFLARMNAEMYGDPLPQGIFWLDFSFNGLPNWSTGRDYLNTEFITYLELKYSSNTAGSVKVITERLTQLRR